MADTEVRITEIDFGDTTGIDVCRLWDNSAAAFVDYDAAAVDYDATSSSEGLDQAADFLYFGNETGGTAGVPAKFEKIGLRLDTVADYGALTWEYWSGAAWASFTPDYEGTEGFEINGYVSWRSASLSGWAANSVNSTTAYWIRVSAASVATALDFFHFLRNTKLDPPVKLRADIETDGLTRDVNGVLRDKDSGAGGTGTLSALCTRRALLMTEINMIEAFRYYRQKVYIEDLAVSSTPNPGTDAFFSNYTGRVRLISPRILSPGKMDLSGRYPIDFLIQSVTVAL